LPYSLTMARRRETGTTIIDCHVHIGSWPQWELHLSLPELDEVKKEYHYTGAVVMPPLTDRDNVIRMNEALRREVQRRNDLYFFAWVHIKPDGSNEAEMLDYLKQNLHTISGLKLHSSISQMAISSKHLEGVLGFANKAHLPLLYHCGRNPISSALPVRDIATTYPGVNFIIGHLGGNAYDRVVDTMRMFRNGIPENVYFDTSTARHPRLLRRAVQLYGEERILFGTDIPFTEMSMNWACLQYAGMADNANILGANFLRILPKSS